jgi:hypothetical protein
MQNVARASTPASLRGARPARPRSEAVRTNPECSQAVRSIRVCLSPLFRRHPKELLTESELIRTCPNLSAAIRSNPRIWTTKIRTYPRLGEQKSEPIRGYPNLSEAIRTTAFFFDELFRCAVLQGSASVLARRSDPKFDHCRPRAPTRPLMPSASFCAFPRLFASFRASLFSLHPAGPGPVLCFVCFGYFVVAGFSFPVCGNAQ